MIQIFIQYKFPLKNLAILPVSTTEVKCSFSILKIQKTQLRNKIGEKHLTDLMSLKL